MPEGAVIVSACLVGIKTRHDGGDALDDKAVEALKGRAFVPVCPEQLGGLPTPRPSAEISGGTAFDVLSGTARVVDCNGMDVTSGFLNGAQAVAAIASLTGATEAFLKDKSPSCGPGLVYSGGALKKGIGVTAALLKSKGLKTTGF